MAMAVLIAATAGPAFATAKAEIVAAWNSGRFGEVVRLIEQTPDNQLAPDRRLVLASAAYNAGQFEKARRHVDRLQGASGLSGAQRASLDTLDALLAREESRAARGRLFVSIGPGSFTYSDELEIADVSLMTAEAEAAADQAAADAGALADPVQACLIDPHELPCAPAPTLPPFE